jgi:drug/metabolite transporter (DMT)-like permease
VIWGILFGFAFWKDIPSATVLLGSAVIVISNIVIVVREHKLKPHSREIFNRHAHPPLSS